MWTSPRWPPRRALCFVLGPVASLIYHYKFVPTPNLCLQHPFCLGTRRASSRLSSLRGLALCCVCYLLCVCYKSPCPSSVSRFSTTRPAIFHLWIISIPLESQYETKKLRTRRYYPPPTPHSIPRVFIALAGCNLVLFGRRFGSGAARAPRWVINGRRARIVHSPERVEGICHSFRWSWQIPR